MLIHPYPSFPLISYTNVFNQSLTMHLVGFKIKTRTIHIQNITMFAWHHVAVNCHWIFCVQDLLTTKMMYNAFCCSPCIFQNCILRQIRLECFKVNTFEHNRVEQWNVNCNKSYFLLHYCNAVKLKLLKICFITASY